MTQQEFNHEVIQRLTEIEVNTRGLSKLMERVDALEDEVADHSRKFWLGGAVVAGLSASLMWLVDRWERIKHVVFV